MTPIDASGLAKVNLALHVTGQREDGYHLLDSFVVFCTDVFDSLTLTPADEMSLTVDGSFADGVPVDATNIVWRAAALSGNTYKINLTKRIPHGAGLGGGSADAAAVLRALNLSDHAVSLGADVPVCLTPMPQRVRGIGEDLVPLWPVPCFHLVLVNPGRVVPTPDVFARLQKRDHAGLEKPPSGADADWLGWLMRQRNDLEPAAAEIAPEIVSVLDAVNDALLWRMTGSGATCFGIYKTPEDAQAAAERIRADHPDWWVTAAQTVGYIPNEPSEKAATSVRGTTPEKPTPNAPQVKPPNPFLPQR